jgi:hypothetical protein
MTRWGAPGTGWLALASRVNGTRCEHMHVEHTRLKAIILLLLTMAQWDRLRPHSQRQRYWSLRGVVIGSPVDRHGGLDLLATGEAGAHYPAGLASHHE